MKPTVVFLHGLARTHRSFGWLEEQIAAMGYPTWARTYPSRELSIVALARHVEEHIRVDLGDGPIAAVTHSLGGVLVRHMSAVRFEAVVMLAPPNRGSRVALALSGLPLYRYFYGPAGLDVTDPTRWPPPPLHCGVIAGTRSRSPGNPTSWLTAGTGLLPRDAPGDGTLLVEETRIPGLDDFTTVDASHTWIVRHPDVPELITHFFEHGRFREKATTCSGD